MNMQTGWTYQTTRNIQHYIDNDEKARSIKPDPIKIIHRPINELDVRCFVPDHLKNTHGTLLASTSDADHKFEAINWQEIAIAWEAERRRLKKQGEATSGSSTCRCCGRNITSGH